jgi:hypothetical protein
MQPFDAPPLTWTVFDKSIFANSTSKVTRRLSACVAITLLLQITLLGEVLMAGSGHNPNCPQAA